MTAEAPVWRVAKGGKGGIVIRMRLTPKSSRAAVEGIERTGDGLAVKARVREIPDKGQANAALTALVARWLAVPKSSVAIAAGATSRVKSVHVAGDAGELGARVDHELARWRRADNGGPAE